LRLPPPGFAILAAVLVLLGPSGFALALYVGLQGSGAVALAFASIGLVFGVSSLVSAFGLIRLRRWVVYSLTVCGLSMVIEPWLEVSIAEPPSPGVPLVQTLLVAAFAALVVYLVRRWFSNTSPRAV
jgi:uncharacterized membrane protein (DUF2068 family)